MPAGGGLKHSNWSHSPGSMPGGANPDDRSREFSLRCDAVKGWVFQAEGVVRAAALASSERLSGFSLLNGCGFTRNDSVRKYKQVSLVGRLHKSIL